MEVWECVQGIYVHIPFCVQKCCYCDFASYKIESKHILERYTEALVREIGEKKIGLPVSEGATVYFGGGTPSVLPLYLLKKIVAALKERGLWRRPAEVTIEANPGTVNLEKLTAYREMGFDRISLGVQSFQDSELKAMGRIHTAAKAKEAIAEARQAGFTRISGDLIYGYPGQTVKSVKDSLQQLIAAGVDHISIYGLSVEPGTVLEKNLREKKMVLPSEDAAGAMYDWIMGELPKKGFQRYEISNFAKPGQRSRHNQVYWHYDPYLAFGAAATGFDGKKRVTNSRNLKDYMEGKPGEVEVLTDTEREEELVFMNLRTAKGLSLDEFQKRTGKNFLEEYGDALEACAKNQWTKMENGRILPTERGMRYGNLLFEEFLK